jgi:hypothetical protein
MFKGRHFDRSVILLCVRWYLAYNLSLRNLEEMMAERGISVDHATVHRWVVRYSSANGRTRCHHRQKALGLSVEVDQEPADCLRPRLEQQPSAAPQDSQQSSPGALTGRDISIGENL